MFSDKDNNNKDVKTVFGKGTKIVGDLETKGSVRVEGEITGKLKAEGDVFIGESGIIKTEIEARKVVIAGKINADIIAHEKLEILSKGALEGDIKCDNLIIEEGASFVGNSSRLKDKNNVTSHNKNKEQNNNKKK
ncbi:MAG: bactofilin family protein [Bacillota bacterium]